MGQHNPELLPLIQSIDREVNDAYAAILEGAFGQYSFDRIRVALDAAEKLFKEMPNEP